MKLSKSGHLTFFLWLALAASITLVLGAAYWAVQQNYRMSANDPQVQITHDAVNDLNEVPDLSQIAGAFGKADISKTYNSFLIIYDEQGKAIAGNGYLGDKLATPPSGVFNTAKKTGENRFSWQPEKGLRFAAVLKQFKGKQNGFVLAARSLAETESREKTLALGMLVAWALSLLVAFVLCGSLGKWMTKHFASHDHTHEPHHAA